MSSSKFGKKAAHHSDDSPEPGPSKRDQYSSDDDEEPAIRKGSSHQCSKMSKHSHMSKKSPGISKQSGGHGHNKPAELFRKDLISAMKLADTEILYDDEYFAISDPWRQEWEKGVQVPVNEEEIPDLNIVEVKKTGKTKDFKMPIRKYLHEKSDETFHTVLHELTGMQELSEQIVRYDLDDLDVTWLEVVNSDREEMGLQLINEWNLERMIEELENQSYSKTNSVKKTEEGLGIEYDEDIACDVCRQLESEDTNEMVFCDGCDICVHQACYGIQTIPEGTWLCRICALGIKPMCLLCPKRGGAMKSTKSGAKWTHVSCALWIPEVSIGCPERMEPITRISNIPASRWALVCCLCKERVGACIQCSVKQCKTAFHVTCGFSHNLDMKTILDSTDEEDGIHLRALCPKHTKNRNAGESPKKNEEDEDNENEENEVEMIRQRVEKLKQLEEEFYTLVDVKEIAAKFYIPEEAVSIVTEYWILKRKVNFNKPLITPKVEEENQMQKQQKDSLSARMKMFVHLRQDLERARNLCYMIGKREKTKKQFFRLQESVFRAQIGVLTDPDLELSSREAEKIRQLYHFESLYSSFSHTSSVAKVPRKNLFTLENLKTPKDLMEEGNNFEAVIKKKLSKRMSLSKKHRRLKQLVKGDIKEEPVSDAGSGAVSEENSKNSHYVGRLNKFLSDTAAESSENEFMLCEGESREDSAQMSHLGKVKGKVEVIEEPDQPDPKNEPLKTTTEELQEVVEPVNKRNAGSDLKMKLTSILKSKSLKQKQDKLSLSSVLHVDVENSDYDPLSSDANTDFVSPAERSRNLFDKFKMKPQWSSHSEDPSPDIPVKNRFDEVRHKKGKKKHRQESRRNKLSKLSVSSSKPDKTEKTEERSIFDIEKDKDKSLLSPRSVTDSSDGDSRVKDRMPNASPSKLSLYKKKSSKDWSISPSHEKSPSSKRYKKMSPSPRVDSDNAYATIDGDFYVPSGKIQVTERTIVLESPKENNKRVSNKLRLKKQTNSPVKGVVSYAVVTDDCDVPDDSFQGGKGKKINVESSETVEEKSIKDVHHSPSLENSPKSDQKKPSEDKILDGKFLSNSDGNISVDVKETIEGTAVRKDLFGITESQSVNKKEKKLKRSLRSKDTNLELDSSSDENFIPINKSIKLVSSPNRSHRLQRESRTSGLLHSNSNAVIKPFPNRPELNALVDPSKLIVKEPLKRDIGDKLSQIVKSRGRWGNRLKVRERDQRTMDAFVKRTSNKLCSSASDIATFGSPLTRSDLKTLNVSNSKTLSLDSDSLNHRLSFSSGNNLDGKNCGTKIETHSLSLPNAHPLAMHVKNSDSLPEDDASSDVSVEYRSSEAGDRADTPRRSTRSRATPEESSQSPLTPSRLRNREGLVKTPVFKSS